MRRKLVLGVVLLLLLAYGGWLFNRVTDRPSSCNSCHFMKPFVENWETSTHNQVNCRDCHWAPSFSDYVGGKLRLATEVFRYALGAYNPQVRSKVKDEACMRCHSLEDLPDTVMYKGTIPFSHKVHHGDTVRGIRATCTTCHYELVQGDHMAVTDEPCIDCHFVGRPENQPVKDCYTCHGPPRDTLVVEGLVFNHSEYLQAGVACATCHVQVTEGRGDVPREACRKCHVERFEAFGEPRRIHQIHVTDQKLKCSDCHTEVRHGKLEVSPTVMPDCQACHRAGHSVQEEMYIGIGGKGVPPTPDPMFLANVACYGCHLPLETLVSPQVPTHPVLPKATPKACENCHGQGFGDLLRMWQATVRTQLTRVESTLRFLEPLKGKNRKAARLFEDARHNVALIREDRSGGAHNIRYSLALLRAARKNLARSEALLLGEKTAAVDREALSVPASCQGCHPDIADHPTEVEGKRFPHDVHMKRLACTTCHSEKVHGKTLKKDCNACHHRGANAEKPCEQCHQTQATLYHGTFQGADEPDVMAEAEVGCSDCHVTDTYPERPTPEICLTCHEEGYDEMLKEWQAETQEGLKHLQAKLDSLYQLLPKLEGQAFREAFRRYREGQRLLKILRQDGSQGAHNIALVEELLGAWSSKQERSP